MFKIEYLSSYNLSFRVGVLCLHWNSIEIKPHPNIQSPKKMSAVMLHFLMHVCEKFNVREENWDFVFCKSGFIFTQKLMG